MRILTLFAGCVLALLLVASAQEVKKPPEVITLGADAKLGPIKFNHLEHATKNHSPDGTKQVACVECHHTAQPVAEAVKHPPHKTAWPADRTTTLTMELAEKDPTAVGAVCHDCHAKAEFKPKVVPVIPEIKNEAGEMVVLNNKEAFHRNCAGCHDEVVKARPNLSPAPPTSKKCTACHKKAAA